jgi:septal ring factor EnvC (AmiA/AmiB activator)
MARDEARADYAKLLESSTAVADNLREDIRQLRSQLTAERTDCQQLQTELASTREELAKLKENPPPATTQNPAAEVKLPDAADLLNQLKKANGKKFTASLTDVEKILESLGVKES